ncbi:MAG: ABC transporter permease [Coriobacteriales bacterium]|jgi:putative ABC transport system permease protein|nr:ABC transporter permease [Coriobacteriales bacterium]
MGIRDLLREIWSSLTANKARSFLTILGIVIGIASVIAMTSLIGGMQGMITGELGADQARVVQIYTSERMDDDDLRALEAAFPEIEGVAGTITGSSKISNGTKTADISLTGVVGDYASMNGFELASGRMLSQSDQDNAARVLVVGRGVLRDLYGDEDAPVLGETVRMGERGERYTIVGILEGNGTSMTYGQALVPAKTLQQRLVGVAGYDQAFVLASVDTDVITLSGNIKTFLTQQLRADEEDVYVYSMQEIMKQIETTMAGFSIMLTAIASISLFVGGIGIMNMMLTTVTERTREIGLRKSLGAHTRDITRQFLAESIALCVVGGVFGIVLGYLGALGLAGIVTLIQPDSGFLPAIDATAILVAFGVCAFIGIVFGFYPARRAARMDPVESLRYQ